jgi:hypothetical protein
MAYARRVGKFSAGGITRIARARDTILKNYSKETLLDSLLEAEEELLQQMDQQETPSGRS